MVYITHLITPTVAAIVLTITFIPMVSRGLYRIFDRSVLALNIFRVLLLFLVVYVTQILVDRHLVPFHCLREPLVPTFIRISPELSGDENLLNADVEQDKRPA